MLLQVHVGPMRSTSRGELRLKSANPEDWILQDPNYLSTPEDMEEFKLAIKLTREIFQMKVKLSEVDTEILCKTLHISKNK